MDIGSFPNPERFRQAFWASNPIPQAVVDRTGRFVLCNDAWTALLGYSRSELEGKHFRDITHPADLEGDGAEVTRLLTYPQASGYSLVKRYLSKRGTIVWVELFVHAVRDEGRQLEYFAVCVIPLPEAVLPNARPDPGFLLRLGHCSLDLLKDRPRECLVAAVLGLVAVGRIQGESLIEALLQYFTK